MKYIKKFESNSDTDPLFEMLDHFKLKWGYDYTFKEGVFTFSEDVDLSGYKMPNGIFPYKIDTSHDLVMKNCGLVSFENFPDRCYGDINVRNNHIKNFQFFPKSVKGDLYCAHNEIEDLIGIPIDMMLENRVKYGDLDRAILDKYWDNQLDYQDITVLVKKLTLSRNTNKNNTVSPESEIGEMVQGITRSKRGGLWDFTK